MLAPGGRVGDRSRRVLEPYLLAGFGGALGALVRYAVSLSLPAPYSTLSVNTLACFLLGFVMYEEIYMGALSAQSRVLLTAGVLGGMSTFSTFIYDALTLAPLSGAAYVLSTLVLGMLGIYAGRGAALYLAGRGWG